MKRPALEVEITGSNFDSQYTSMQPDFIIEDEVVLEEADADARRGRKRATSSGYEVNVASSFVLKQNR